MKNSTHSISKPAEKDNCSNIIKKDTLDKATELAFQTIKELFRQDMHKVQKQKEMAA